MPIAAIWIRFKFAPIPRTIMLPKYMWNDSQKSIAGFFRIIFILLYSIRKTFLKIGNDFRLQDFICFLPTEMPQCPEIEKVLFVLYKYKFLSSCHLGRLNYVLPIEYTISRKSRRFCLGSAHTKQSMCENFGNPVCVVQTKYTNSPGN